jgi:Ser/Thr protein kinase RdoA (MazF antagonist)
MLPVRHAGIDPAVLATIFARYGADPASARLLGRSQNHVYACTIGGEPAVLRVCVGRHRTADEVGAELAWTRELAAHGLPVCNPRTSPAGRWCERFAPAGDAAGGGAAEHLVVRFDPVPGGPVPRDDCRPATFAALGRLTAALHAATFDAGVGRACATGRPHWHASRLLNEDLAFLPPADESAGFRAALRSLVADLRAVPPAPDRYGLIHADVSFANVFADAAGGLHLFDFDNCERGWVEQDLATVAYDAIYTRLVTRTPAAEMDARVAAAWRSFRDGYQSVRPTRGLSAALLSDFLVLREAVIYVHYHRILDLAALPAAFRDGIAEMGQWVERRRPRARLGV